ncbi:CinA family protein [Microbacterium sp. NPDC076895]|uniref:CinA family protein n=1 Tax=Microbacterium sp. NPDC076895 TaxID=3154957 RepID=UPI0034494506
MTSDVSTAASKILETLRARGWRLGVAESLTGGSLASAFVSVPGASDVLRGGIVAYATDLKASLLGVDAALLGREGAVHPDVAIQMARGIRVATAQGGALSEVGLATTGVAGPDPQDGAPVGRVYVAVVTPEREAVTELELAGDRAAIRAEAVAAALEMLRVSL